MDYWGGKTPPKGLARHVIYYTAKPNISPIQALLKAVRREPGFLASEGSEVHPWIRKSLPPSTIPPRSIHPPSPTHSSLSPVTLSLSPDPLSPSIHYPPPSTPPLYPPLHSSVHSSSSTLSPSTLSPSNIYTELWLSALQCGRHGNTPENMTSFLLQVHTQWKLTTEDPLLGI